MTRAPRITTQPIDFTRLAFAESKGFPAFSEAKIRRSLAKTISEIARRGNERQIDPERNWRFTASAAPLKTKRSDSQFTLNVPPSGMPGTNANKAIMIT
jgi:hypothetical protein